MLFVPKLNLSSKIDANATNSWTNLALSTNRLTKSNNNVFNIVLAGIQCDNNSYNTILDLDNVVIVL